MSQQRKLAEQSHQMTQMLPGQYYDSAPTGPKQFYGGQHQMQTQMWHQHMQQQYARPDSQQMYGSYRSGGSPQTPRSANMSTSMSSQGNMQGMMYDMEPTINFVESQSPRGTYSQQHSQSGTPNTVRSVVREPSDFVSVHMTATPPVQGMAATPPVQGMQAETGVRALTRMLGNYITDAQADRMAESSSSKTAMTAQVFNPHGHLAMTATIFNAHKTEQTMLAQTGGNDPDSQNLFAQTQPETSEMSTQTEPLVENLSTSMLNMLVRDGSEEGQEHKIVQSEMSQPAQDDAKSGEEETYATNLWQDLQQTIEQDCLTEGQEPQPGHARS
jgi:hypothetical protein